MIILHISTRLILGGSQENTVLSCEGQAAGGHAVHLAFGPIYGPEGSLLQRVQSQGSITTHVVPSMVRQISLPKDRAALAELAALLHSVKPDVVHTHSSKAGILGRVAAWRYNRTASRKAGIVHTIHGPPFMPVEGAPLERLKVRAVNHGYTLAERHAARRCHAIVSVADSMTLQFLARGIGDESLYTTVYSGMDTEAFLIPSPGEDRAAARAALHLADTDIVIGTVARLAQHKGHDDLLTALGEDLRTRRELKLLWVGDGWWRERLVARVQAMGLSVAATDDPDFDQRAAGASILLTGLVPPQRVPMAMRAMDILAHPSFREGLPRTVPQALLAGVVPVAYDCDGTAEACIDGQTGRLVPLGSTTKLREAILGLVARPDERARLARTGQAMCATRFAASTMVAQLQSVYARAISVARA